MLESTTITKNSSKVITFWNFTSNMSYYVENFESGVSIPFEYTFKLFIPF